MPVISKILSAFHHCSVNFPGLFPIGLLLCLLMDLPLFHFLLAVVFLKVRVYFLPSSFSLNNYSVYFYAFDSVLHLLKSFTYPPSLLTHSISRFTSTASLILNLTLVEINVIRSKLMLPKTIFFFTRFLKFPWIFCFL